MFSVTSIDGSLQTWKAANVNVQFTILLWRKKSNIADISGAMGSTSIASILGSYSKLVGGERKARARLN